MPPIETYAVDFANGNLIPHIDSPGWGNMQLSTPSENDLAQSWPDSKGMNLRLTRGLLVPAGESAANSIFVVPPPGSQSLESRLFMRVTFDLPRAHGISTDPQAPFAEEVDGAGVDPASPKNPAIFDDPEVSLDPPTDPAPVTGETTVPEPWAIALIVTDANSLPGLRGAVVTCQFSDTFKGVRLNTPAVSGVLQVDKASCIDQPLNYAQYQDGYYVAVPGGIDGVFPAPVFTLEHAFCGYGASPLSGNGHAVGSGSLKMSFGYGRELADQRVYSTDALSAPGMTIDSIGALGVSLITTSGIGILSVRLRNFSLWRNPPA
jgi:hypothetical protein